MLTKSRLKTFSEWKGQQNILSNEDFLWFKEQVFHMSGITLSNQKRELVQSRLMSRLIQLQLNDFSMYRKYLQSKSKNEQEWEIFVNAITTNKTSFFRESNQIEWVCDYFIPEWLKLGKKHLNVWSAACSTGEEVYTLAILLKHSLPHDINFQIVGTDINTVVIDTAKNGVYKIDKLAEIPEVFRSSSFVLGKHGLENWMLVRQNLKKHVMFKYFNLINEHVNMNLEFDVIFCRNVFIYFSTETIESVIASLYKSASEKACMIIGQAESLNGLNLNGWKYLMPSIFIKNNSFNK